MMLQAGALASGARAQRAKAKLSWAILRERGKL